MVRSMTARPDARGAGEGIPVHHRSRKNSRRIPLSLTVIPDRQKERHSRTPEGGASARPPGGRPAACGSVFRARTGDTG